jgi:hypothetical protein
MISPMKPVVAITLFIAVLFCALTLILVPHPISTFSRICLVVNGYSMTVLFGWMVKMWNGEDP